MNKDNFSLSVILPAYNEEKNIEGTLKQVFDILPSITNDFEVIVVDDGSSDKTYTILSNLKDEYKGLDIVRHKVNKGYGKALISGFDRANKDYIFFMDSDGQFEFKEIKKLLIFKDDYDIVAGIRIERKDELMRELYGTIFNLIIKFMFRIPIMDIDCGFKLFKKAVIKGIKLYSTGALINTELLFKARINNNSLMIVGVTHYPRKKGKQSGASLKVILTAIIEILKLKYKLIRNK